MSLPIYSVFFIVKTLQSTYHVIAITTSSPTVLPQPRGTSNIQHQSDLAAGQRGGRRWESSRGKHRTIDNTQHKLTCSRAGDYPPCFKLLALARVGAPPCVRLLQLVVGKRRGRELWKNW